MENEMKFESPRHEIEYLEQRILEKKKEILSGDSKKAVTEVLRAHTGTSVSGVTPTTTTTDTEAEKYIAQFIQIAFEKGVLAAVDQVRNTHNPYLIDAFHDALADRFVEDLVTRGLLPHGQ